MKCDRLCRLAGLAAIFLASAGMFLTAKEAWRRAPALELAVLAIVAIAGIEALGEKKR